jgi:hypothetical protein
VPVEHGGVAVDSHGPVFPASVAGVQLGADVWSREGEEFRPESQSTAA